MPTSQNRDMGTRTRHPAYSSAVRFLFVNRHGFEKISDGHEYFLGVNSVHSARRKILVAKKIPTKASSTKKIAGGADERQQQISGNALPRRSLEQALIVAEKLREVYAGKSATWEELGEALGISVKNKNFKYLVWSAAAYGLVTTENEQARKLYSLGETGRKIVAETFQGEAQEAKVKAVMTPTVLSQFYTDYNNNPIPGAQHIDNVLETRYKVPRDRTKEATEIILANGKFAGIFEEQTLGQPPIVRLTGVPSGSLSDAKETERSVKDMSSTNRLDVAVPRRNEKVGDAVAWDTICFYITPLGEEGSEERRHADMMLRHVLKPVFEDASINFQVVRADEIAKTGLITSQILEHLARARLCVADMSFRNPNAFYELGVRHAFLLPTIQIIHKTDKIPFDVSQGRTITIDTSDRYTIADRLESARKELREYVNNLLHDAGVEVNPVAVYLPG